MTPMDEYLDQAELAKWRWGQMDCCMFAGNWIAAATEHDPMAAYRGIYDTAFQAGRLIRSRGGLVAMADLEMQRCGFIRVEAAEHGDIGVLELPQTGPKAMKVAGASICIRSSVWWVGKTLSGTAWVNRPALAVWRVLK